MSLIIRIQLLYLLMGIFTITVMPILMLYGYSRSNLTKNQTSFTIGFFTGMGILLFAMAGGYTGIYMALLFPFIMGVVAVIIAKSFAGRTRNNQPSYFEENEAVNKKNMQDDDDPFMD